MTTRASQKQHDHSVFDSDLTGSDFDLAVLRRLLSWVVPHSKAAIASGVLVVAASILAVLGPVVISRVVIDGILLPTSGFEAPTFGMQALTDWLSAESGVSRLAAACTVYSVLVIV